MLILKTIMHDGTLKLIARRFTSTIHKGVRFRYILVGTTAMLLFDRNLWIVFFYTFGRR